MSAISNTGLTTQLERAKKKYGKVTMLNQIIDGEVQMSQENKINALVLIARELLE